MIPTSPVPIPMIEDTDLEDRTSPVDEHIVGPSKRRRSDPLVKDRSNLALRSIISEEIEHTLHGSVLHRLSIELEQRFSGIQRQQNATTTKAHEALAQISDAFARLQASQTAQEASIKLTADNANLIAATVSIAN